MPRIDYFLGVIKKLNASGVLLASGKNITMRFPSGDKVANQTTAHADLLALVNEIAPSSVETDILLGQPARFDHAHQGETFQVLVEPASGSVRIAITAPGAVAAGAAAPLPIEKPPAPTERSTARMNRTGTPGTAPAGAEAVAAPAPAPMAAPAPTPMAAPAPTLEPRHEAPLEPGQAAAIDQLLLKMKEMGASDLHLSCTVPPIVRHHGEMKRLEQWPPFTPEAMIKMLYEICPEKNRVEFEARNDTDFAYAIPKVSRFRCNFFRDRHGPGAVLRAIPFEILSPEQLGLPAKVLDLCYLTKGLVVVTGPTGSGKSTTLATLIDYVNTHRSDHIITIEDPIEFVHENKRCLINQREIKVHTSSFKDALRAALREDPDIVLVGEMRDLETIAIAVETAETGHLVFGTLHTTTAPSTVDRIIDQFPADRQEQIRQMLAESLRGVIAQTLCKKIGGGRAAAYEILIGTSAVSNLIREGKTFQLFSLIQTSRNVGMITLNDSLIEHVKAKRIEPLEAYMKAVNKSEIKGQLQKLGIEINLQEEKKPA